MDYEQLYVQLQKLEKELKDRLTTAQKLHKNIVKGTDSGDLKSVVRDIQALDELTQAQSQTTSELKAAVDGFDAKTYFESGDFETQLLQCCERYGVDVKGAFPVYEMFPYRVRLDPENQDLYLNRKKIQCMRPISFVAIVKASQDKLNRASFNAQTFAGELCDAYDLALLRDGKRAGSDVYLSTLYKLLAPMGRHRRDYDQNSYAFDLARLYSSGVEETKSGRRLQFGTSRDNNKAIRILDNEGHELFLATVCFYNPE